MMIVDIIPNSDSAESGQNAEPSLALDPLNPSNMIAGAFADSFYANDTPYLLSTNGGGAWSDYGSLNTEDKSIAWTMDGSAALTATLTGLRNGGTEITVYSGTTGSGNFGSLIFTYRGVNNSENVDQPWIVTGPSSYVYIGYNDLGATNTETASVLVSANGGSSFTPVTLDRVGAGAGQDAPSIRLAVNGSTVYAVFTRWTSSLGTDAVGNNYYTAQVVVARSDNGGTDDFGALGTNGNGVTVGTPTGYFSNTDNSAITLGQQRTASDVAIAVDPNNANHVVIAYGDATGGIGSGQLVLHVAESTDGGQTWTTKYTTSLSVRSALPGLAILSDGEIGLLYARYDPGTNELSQHLLTTTNDFASVTDTALATETNATPTFTSDPYIGDFYDLTSVGNIFYGIFSASNNDNGNAATGAQFFFNVRFQRDYTGTPGTGSFQLTNASGKGVATSIDPFFFSTIMPTWNEIDGGTPSAMTAGDFEGLGSAQLVASETGAGTYIYVPSTTTWTKIDGGVPTMMTAGNLYGTLNGNNNNADLIAYYPGYGTYTWQSGHGWTKIDSGSPTAITTGAFTGGSVDEIAASFSGYGVYLWSASGGWDKIDSGSPTMLAAGDIYGTNNGNVNGADLAAYYPGVGTYIWGANTGWNKIDSGTPSEYAVGNFLGIADGNNNQADLAAYFPSYGTYIWSANAGWMKIDSGAPTGLAAVDIDGDGKSELLAYFANYGMYEWQAGVGWNTYDSTSALPNTSQTPIFATGNFQGGADVLAAVGFNNTAGVWLDPPGSGGPQQHAAVFGDAANDTLGYAANADISGAAADMHTHRAALFGQAIASWLGTASNRPATALFHAAEQLLEHPTLSFSHPHGSA